MKTLLDQKVTAVVSAEILIRKNLPDAGFPLNLGALTISLGKKNFIVDSEKTNFSNKQKKGKKLYFETSLGVDLDTFEPSADYNYELSEMDLKDKKLKAVLYCSDCDCELEDAFDLENADVKCILTVDGKKYEFPVELEQ